MPEEAPADAGAADAGAGLPGAASPEELKKRLMAARAAAAAAGPGRLLFAANAAASQTTGVPQPAAKAPPPAKASAPIPKAAEPKAAAPAAKAPSPKAAPAPALAGPVIPEPDTEPPPADLPPIRRLRVALLGGDVPLPGVGKADVAGALLRGFTADQPGASDPTLDFAFDRGVFERAWLMLLKSPPDGDPGSDGWSLGQMHAWGREGRMKFDRKLRGKTSLPFDAEPIENCGSVCPGFAGKLDCGHPLTKGLGQRWREVLTNTGISVDKLAALHKDMYKMSEADPRMLVRKNRPMPGVLCSFARFSPEIGPCGKSSSGHLPGCGAVIITVFNSGARPEGSEQNVAMLYTVAPNSRDNSELNAGDFLCALRAQGANIIRAVREYNRLAMQYPPPGEMERVSWWSADLRAHVEYYLSDRNMKFMGPLPGGEMERGETTFKDAVLHASNGWLDLGTVRGPTIITSGATAQELVDALSNSRTLELTVDNEGRANIRRKNLEYLFCPGGVLSHEPVPDHALAARKKRKVDEALHAAQLAQGIQPGSPEAEAFAAAQQGKIIEQENICWDWKNKGHCPRGEDCKYSHVLTASAQGLLLQQKGMSMKGVSKAGMPDAPALPAGVPPIHQFPGGKGRIPRGMSTVQAFMMRPTMKMHMPEQPETLKPKPVEVVKPKVGCKVKIHGLVMKAKYNDCIADVESFDDDTGRWSVRLGDGSTISVKDANITVQE